MIDRRVMIHAAHLVLQVGGLFFGILSSGVAWSKTNLHTAASEGRLSQVVEAIAGGGDLDERDLKGRTAIWHAASAGRIEVLSFLAEAGAQLDPVDRFGVSPLTVAIRRGHVVAVRVLLEAGTSPNPTRADRFTPLHMAVEQDNAEIVDLLLSAGADPLVQRTTGDPTTDLTRNTMIRLRLRGMLLGRIAFLKPERGLSPLPFSIGFPAADAVFAVVRISGLIVFEREVKGPFVPPTFSLQWDGKTENGTSVESGRYSFRLRFADGSVSELARRVVRAEDVSLFEAAAFGDRDLMAAVLGRGEGVDGAGAYGRTPLMLAAAFANVETARVLIESGASPFKLDSEKRTALDYARIYSPTHDIVPLLQSYQDEDDDRLSSAARAPKPKQPRSSLRSLRDLGRAGCEQKNGRG